MACPTSRVPWLKEGVIKHATIKGTIRKDDQTCADCKRKTSDILYIIQFKDSTEFYYDAVLKDFEHLRFGLPRKLGVIKQSLSEDIRERYLFITY
jgi:hypothetical protein